MIRSSAKRLIRRARPSIESVERTPWYVRRWSEAADATGWRVSWRDGPFLELERHDRRLRVGRSDAGIDSNVTFRIVADKARTNRRLGAAGVPTPTGEVFDIARPDRILRAIATTGSCVVKPTVGTGGGSGITVAPPDRRAAIDAIRGAAVHGRSLIVEDHVDGRVLRVLVLDGVVLDAVHRRPAEVTGDGSSTVRALVEAENDRRRALGENSTGFLVFDSDHRAALRRGGRTATSVLAPGETLAVAGVSNSGSARESERLSVAPMTEQLAVKAAEAVGVRLAGVDLVIDENDRPVAVLEVNTAPGLHWHELVAGEAFDPFVAILSAEAGS